VVVVSLIFVCVLCLVLVGFPSLVVPALGLVNLLPAVLEAVPVDMDTNNLVPKVHVHILVSIGSHGQIDLVSTLEAAAPGCAIPALVLDQVRCRMRMTFIHK